ncbi:hypothetical protein PCASD_05177 [Puccinia coronata f. sp. avenae]|uniref:Reverse transcriptase domain-containing protein n=1 Tax=Puccinia coronata f. sp. avenae TaxID=200324 RepID=A0A2N5V3L3_9BASI|nr:hypothetical protein PCASD_05177 [Puccinia coronata f. sp. avenae]
MAGQSQLKAHSHTHLHGRKPPPPPLEPPRPPIKPQASPRPPGHLQRSRLQNGVPTFSSSKGTGSTIDLIWANFLASRLVNRSEVLLENHGSDHQAVELELPFRRPTPAKRLTRPKWGAVPHEIACKRLDGYIDQMRSLSPASVDESIRILTEGLKNTQDSFGRTVVENPQQAKSWWCKKTLDPIIDTRNRARQWHILTKSPESAECYRQWSSYFRATVKSLKRNSWLRFLENAEDDTLWQALQILPKEVADCIKKISPKKAPGEDGIANEMLKISSLSLAPPLTKILNQSLSISHFPTAWKCAIMAIIPKAGKDNYTDPNAYRPISLLSSLGKIFELAITRRLTAWAEKNNILADGHLGCRKGAGTEDAMVILDTWVRRKWHEKKTVATLFLDVKSAYPSVHPNRLIHYTAGINRSNTAVRAVLKQPCSTSGRTGTVRPKHLPAGRTGLSNQFLGPVAQDQPGPVWCSIPAPMPKRINNKEELHQQQAGNTDDGSSTRSGHRGKKGKKDQEEERPRP